MSARLEGRAFVPPPATTPWARCTGTSPARRIPGGYHYQPTNVTFGLFPPLEGRLRKADKRQAYAERGARDFGPWLEASERAVNESPFR